MRISADCIDHEVKNQIVAETSSVEPESVEKHDQSTCSSSMDEPKNLRQIGVTHQSGGIKTSSGLHMRLLRKENPVKIPFPDANTSWCCFRTRLLQACNISPSSEVEILYLDEEDDKININSEDEYLEAMRVAEHLKPFVLIVKESCAPHASGASAKDSRMENLKPRSFKVISDMKGYSSESDDDLCQSVGIHSSARSGVRSSAVGMRSSAVGLKSSAVGLKSSAVGVSSSAVGVSSSAVGVSSSAVGVSSSAVGVSSSAVGMSSSAVGVSSSAVGINANTYGISSTPLNLDMAKPPLWFESYMMKMEAEIISKVSKELEHMMATVLQALKPEGPRNEQQIPVVNEDEGVLHEGITCDYCEQVIHGVRYKCATCDDFDLCTNCEAIPNVHTKDHLFLKIRQPLRDRGTKHSLKQSKSGLVLLNQSSDIPVANLPIWSSRAELPRSKHDRHKMAKMMKKMVKRSAGHPLAAVKVRSSSLSADGTSHHWPERRLTEPNLVRELGLPKYGARNLMDAHFIEDGNVPDGMLMPPGELFVKRWKVRNTGTKSWNSHTSLKYCWGTAGLIPRSKEVHVPHLKPLEEGVLSVEFVAPTKPGRYQSHWRLYHRCYAFGHQLWCNIEVAPSGESVRPSEKEPKSTETQLAVVEKLSKKPTEVTDDIAQALSVVQVEQENGQLGGRKKVVISHTTTPTNTPFDMTPPKSPEPHLKEAPKFVPPLEIPNSKLNLADAEKDKLSDGEETASVLSLSSSDSDTEFVVIPNPSPFGMAPFRAFTPTTLSEPMTCSQYSLMTTDSFEMVRRKSGSNSGNGDEETCKTSTVSEHPASSSSDIATAESSGGEEYLRSDKTMASYATTGCISQARGEPLSVTDDVKSGLDTQAEEAFSSPQMQPSEPPSTPKDDDSAQNSNQDHVTVSLANSTSNASAVTSTTASAAATVAHRNMTTGEAAPLSPTAASVISKTVSTSINPQAYTNAVNSQEGRTIDVLPESLMNAAATVYNTTREFISSMQRQNEPPQDSFCTSSPRSPTEWTPPTRATMTPMENLVEMGFCNLSLNESLLEKHKGDIAEVVAELVATSDNDWFSHRHRPETQLTFD